MIRIPSIIVGTRTPQSIEDPGHKMSPEQALQKAIERAERCLTGEFLVAPLEAVRYLIEDSLKFYQATGRIDVEVLYVLYETGYGSGLDIKIDFIGTAPLGSDRPKTTRPKMMAIGCDWAIDGR